MDLRLLRYFVAVAEEGHVGRAAARLRMSQPPLSRAIHQLENDLGVVLLDRTRTGVELTAVGAILYDEARSLLDHADRVRARMTTAAGTAKITVGTLADTAEQVGTDLVAAFRARHPNVDVVVHESDLTDPTAGLRSGLVDVAFTRTPFDTAGITYQVLHTEPLGVVVNSDDPLARRQSVAISELIDRRWVQLPESTDPLWRAYWTVRTPNVVRAAKTIQECVQSVLWNGALALAPLGQPLPKGLALVPVTDREPNKVVVAWNSARPSPLVRSFVAVAAGKQW